MSDATYGTPITAYDMVRKSKECVINIPTVDLATTVVRIGNTSGRDIDKFAEFKLTPSPAKKVSAPLIAECYANFECRLVDSSLIKKYGTEIIGGPFQLTFVNNFYIIGQGSGYRYLGHETFHVTLDADGNVVVLHDSAFLTCPGN